MIGHGPVTRRLRRVRIQILEAFVKFVNLIKNALHGLASIHIETHGFQEVQVSSYSTQFLHKSIGPIFMAVTLLKFDALSFTAIP